MRGAPFRGPKIGERLGRFRIDSAWSSGPLGPTARARMLASDKPATLHVLPGPGPADASLPRAPGLLSMLDAWTEEDVWMVALEDPPAGATPLRVAVQRLTTSSTARIGAAIARALLSSHRAGLAHGVLCPELITFDPGREATIVGFGIASGLGSAGLLRAAGATGGRYLAPEQIRELAPSPASDVHAIGAMLYEIVAGHPPYRGETSVALFASIATDPMPPLPSTVPAPLGRAITRALAKSPSARFTDASELLAALESAPMVAEIIAPRGGDDEITWSAAAADDGPVGQRGAERSRERMANPGRAPRFTGALAQQQLAYARTRYAAAVDAALARLSPADRDEVASATAVSWVRVEAFERFHDALARELGRPVDETHAELVAGGSRKTFGTLWRMLLRVGGARLVMTRAPVVYAKTYDTGEMRSRDISDVGGAFVLDGWPQVPEFVLRGLRAGMTVGLESVGRTGVVLTSTRTPDGAVFHARWDR